MPQGIYLRKYGVQTTIDFSLFEVDGVDLRVDAVHALGDTKIMKDEGAEANTTNGFTDEGQGYSIVVSATELQCARAVIHVVDQTATKVWLDDTIIIETYGNASAMHAFDLDTSSTAQTGDSFARLGAPAGASIAADLLAIDNFVDDLESRLTAVRAGYLDELGAANMPADLDTLIARLTAARAGYLDNLSGHIPQTGDTYAQLPTNFSSMGIETDGHVHADLKQWLGTAPLALSSQRVQTHVGSMAAGVITATVIADAAIDAATLAADMDSYQAVLTMVIDSSGNNLYGVDYVKNGEPIESGITLPKINVKKASDGSDLVAETALTEVASLGRYKHDESTNKITAGLLYKVKVKGTIGGSVREWNYHMWRDA